MHFSEADALFAVELSEAASIADVLAKVRDQVAKAKPGEWVRGRGWDEGKFAERRYVTAADLDKVAPNNPGVAGAHDRPLRRRQQLRAEDVGGDRGDDRRRRPGPSTATRRATRPA